ncbi:exported hypothetical protein [Streptomyces murinus]
MARTAVMAAATATCCARTVLFPLGSMVGLPSHVAVVASAPRRAGTFRPREPVPHPHCGPAEALRSLHRASTAGSAVRRPEEARTGMADTVLPPGDCPPPALNPAGRR